MAIPKRAGQRIRQGLSKFRKVLESARNADRSEQDTVTVVTDMLAGVFGYDKYEEITAEYAIRGTYCDLAIKVGGKVRYLIEVKAVDKSLKDSHLRQATDYASKEGIEWVLLTNGIEWQVHRMVFEQPVRSVHVFTMNMLDEDPDLHERVFMLCRECVGKEAMAEFHEQRVALSRYSLAAVVLSDPVLSVIRRELRRMSPGVRIDAMDIESALRTDLIKRDVVNSKDTINAARRLKRASTRRLRRSRTGETEGREADGV